MKPKHILPSLAALLMLLCGCDTTLPDETPAPDTPPATAAPLAPDTPAPEETIPPDGQPTVGEHTHAPDAWQTVLQPTCTEEGMAEGDCALCGETLRITLEKLAHTYTEAVTPPTCEAEGYTRFTCACGYTYDTAHTPPTGHTYTEAVTPPTCEAEGYTRFTCACGYTYDTAHTPPTGHTYTETVTPPTCTESGYTRYHCSACGHGYDAAPTVPLAHANATAERVYPTVSRDGYTLHTCPDCGESYRDGYVSYGDIVTGAYTDNTKILMQGIDTSKWNHEYGASLEDIKPLDFAALKAAGMDFVILKAGSSKGIDPAFEMDYLAAKAAGLQVGAYFYAYSATAEGTVKDAEMLLAWLEGKQFELPIYFDAEDTTLMGLGQATLTELCRVFAERLQEAGYYAALYTNTEWLYNLLDTDWVKRNLDVWYARYTADAADGSSAFAPTDGGFSWKDGTAYKPGETDKRFGLWQYTCYGSVEGFRYRFDFNYAFKDYKSLMVKWGLNGYGTPMSPPADPAAISV